MKQVFSPRANLIARASILGTVLLIVAVFFVMAAEIQPEYIKREGIIVEQEVPFSHQHHAGQLGIDCRFCHTSVEESEAAGFPSTQTCMTCHSQVWTESPLLEPVRKSFRENTPLEWNRVHNLPDFAFFNHSIHISKGVSCRTCHGRVDKMPLMWQENALAMQWCLECHRDPADKIQPVHTVFEMESIELSEEEGEALEEKYNIFVKQLDNCTICHR